jgi:hypothetical protein
VSEEHPWFIAKISIGEIVLVATLLFGMAVAWSNMSTRLEADEAAIKANTDLLKNLSEGQSLQNQTLKILNQRMEDYPLHIHSDHEIIYPNGRTKEKK